LVLLHVMLVYIRSILLQVDTVSPVTSAGGAVLQESPVDSLGYKSV